MPTEGQQLLISVEARINKLERAMGRAAGVTNSRFGQMEARADRAAKRLEQSMANGAAGITRRLSALAPALAAVFSGREVLGMIDSYTRFTNQLKVAGAEGEALAATQRRLFEIAQRYGVSLEAVGTLYGRNAASAKELGLSQAEQLKIVEATSAALKTSGQTSEQAAGALLQLSQALGGSKIQAQEFNSLIDGARPLLQAVAAGSERWGGSVAKLTADVKAGNVSTRAFVDALLNGADGAIKQAESATLTLSAAIQTLRNSLTLYVGEAGATNGTTAAMAQAIRLLADNLDTVAAALGVVATVMFGRYVAGVVAGTRATVAAAGAAAGATTTMGTMAAAATVAGRAMLAAFGGPVGIAIAALSVGLYLVANRTAEVTEAAKAKQRAMERASEADRIAAKAADQLASASKRERAEIIAAMKASRERAAQSLQTAKAHLVEARAALAVAQANARKEIAQASFSTRGAGGGIDPIVVAGDRRQRNVAPLESAVEKAEALYAKGLGALDGLDRAIRDASAPVTLAPAGDGSTGSPTKPSTSRAATGPTAAEIAEQHADALGRLQQEELQARLQIAADAFDRADLEREILALEAQERRRQIENDEHFTADQKAAQLAVVDALYGKAQEIDANGDIVVSPNTGLHSRAIQQELEEALAEQARTMLGLQIDALSAEADLADTRQDRLDAEHRLLDIMQREERSRLDSAIAAGEIADADAARALLARRQAAQRDRLERDFESPMQAYRRALTGDVNDQLEAIEVDGIERLSDALTAATTKALGLTGALRDIVGQLIKIGIQRAIIGPIANALFGPVPGFAEGGFTGPGGKHQPAGIVHRGEYVFDQNATQRIGVPALEALRRGAVPGFANGGYVGTPPRRAANDRSLTFATSATININSPAGSGLSRESAKAASKALERETTEFMERWIGQEMRPGGRLARR